MRLSGRPGKAKLHLRPGEVQLLDRMLGELDGVVASADEPAVSQRLYPAAVPDDPAASEHFRELTENALRTGRQERIAACRTELAALPIQLGDPDAARRWLQVLNDLRLVLGTRLGVTEDGRPEIDPEDTAAMAPWAIYDYLTGVQDMVVQALMH